MSDRADRHAPARSKLMRLRAARLMRDELDQALVPQGDR